MTILRKSGYLKEDMTHYMDQHSNQSAIESVTQQIKHLELQESNIRKAIRLIDADRGMEGFLADLKLITMQKQKAQKELERLEQDQIYQEAARKRMESGAFYSLKES